jgi:hypothetical protein
MCLEDWLSEVKDVRLYLFEQLRCNRLILSENGSRRRAYLTFRSLRAGVLSSTCLGNQVKRHVARSCLLGWSKVSCSALSNSLSCGRPFCANLPRIAFTFQDGNEVHFEAGICRRPSIELDSIGETEAARVFDAILKQGLTCVRFNAATVRPYRPGPL